jgi:hypothetical protein
MKHKILLKRQEHSGIKYASRMIGDFPGSSGVIQKVEPKISWLDLWFVPIDYTRSEAWNIPWWIYHLLFLFLLIVNKDNRHFLWIRRWLVIWPWFTQNLIQETEKGALSIQTPPIRDHRLWKTESNSWIDMVWSSKCWQKWPLLKSQGINIRPIHLVAEISDMNHLFWLERWFSGESGRKMAPKFQGTKVFEYLTSSSPKSRSGEWLPRLSARPSCRSWSPLVLITESCERRPPDLWFLPGLC